MRHLFAIIVLLSAATPVLGAELDFASALATARVRLAAGDVEPSYKAALAIKAENASRTFGTVSLDLEARRRADEGSLEALVNLPVHLGESQEEARSRLGLGLQADMAELTASRLEAATALIESYLDLRQYAREFAFQKQVMEKLRPLARNVEATASRGGIAALAALKWRLLTKNLERTQAISRERYVRLRKYFAEEFELEAATDPAAAQLSAPPPSAVKLEAAAVPAVAASVARIAALEREILAAESGYDFSVGAGVETVRGDAEKSWIVAVSLPLNQGVVQKSRARELRGDAEIARKKAEYENLRWQRTLRLMSEHLASSEVAVKANADHVRELEIILEEVEKGFVRGVTDFSEVMEAVDALFTSTMELFDTERHHEAHLAKFHILSGERP